MANLADLLADATRRFATRPALLHEGAQLDYRALDDRAGRFAGLFRARGVAAGERVAILLPNVPDFVAAYYGALRVGAIVVPLNPLLADAEIEQRIRSAGARVLVVPRERAGRPAGVVGTELLDPSSADGAEPIHEAIDVHSGDPAVLLFTSGTSGGAKGVELTHSGLRANAAFLATSLLELSPADVVLGAAPFSHVLGQSGVMSASILSGACVALMPRFDAGRVLELIERESVSVFLGVPAMCIALLREAGSAAAVPPLRVAHVGGAPLAPETLRAFAERFGCPVLEGYGMTEIGGVVATHRPGRVCKPGSVGPAADGVEIRVVDGVRADLPAGAAGEVLIRSPALMRGYWQDEDATREATDAAGWFPTGDIGRLDDDGYLFLVDRRDDVILRGGYNVYPREIEDVLHDHPAVHEAAVVGVDDATLGQEVAALVVPRPGATCDPGELQAFVRERVAAYKYPRLIVLAGDLPRTASGKILRREIDRAALRSALDLRRPPGAGSRG